jgi:hypothetical protein
MSTGGVVQSGNFPGDYGKDARNCGVTITTPAGWMIQLKFTTFNLEFKKAFVYVRKRNQISALDDSVILILFELSGVRLLSLSIVRNNRQHNSRPSPRNHQQNEHWLFKIHQ